MQRELLERDILTGTSGDPHVVRLLPPFVLDESQHVDALRDALACLARLHSRARQSTDPPLIMQRFLDLADFSRDEVVDLLALAARLQDAPGAAARSPARSSACCS